MEISCVTCTFACQTFVVLARHETFYIYACICGDVVFPLWSRERFVQQSIGRLCQVHISVRDNCILLGPHVYM